MSRSPKSRVTGNNQATDVYHDGYAAHQVNHHLVHHKLEAVATTMVQTALTTLLWLYLQSCGQLLSLPTQTLLEYVEGITALYGLKLDQEQPGNLEVHLSLKTNLTSQLLLFIDRMRLCVESWFNAQTTSAQHHAQYLQLLHRNLMQNLASRCSQNIYVPCHVVST